MVRYATPSGLGPLPSPTTNSKRYWFMSCIRSSWLTSGHITSTGIRQLSSRGNIFHEVLDSGLVGSVDDQIKEIAADGYAAFFVLTHLFDERRSSFLPFLKFDPSPPPVVLDQVFLAFFVAAMAGYMFLRQAPDLNGVNVYRLTHPPVAARLNFLMREVTAWCSHNRPALEGWITSHFDALMNATVEAILGVGDYTSGLGQPNSILKYS